MRARVVVPCGAARGALHPRHGLPHVRRLLCCAAQALRASGTTYISVGHRPTLKRHHSSVLQLRSAHSGPDGSGREMAWELMPAALAGRSDD